MGQTARFASTLAAPDACADAVQVSLSRKVRFAVLALLCATLFACTCVAAAPAQAYALSQRTQPLDFTQDQVWVQSINNGQGGYVDVEANVTIDADWEDYGWKLTWTGNHGNTASILTLKDGFTLACSGEAAIKLTSDMHPKLTLTDRDVVIELEGSASVTLEGASATSAALALQQATVRAASAATGTPKLTATATGQGYGIALSEAYVAVDKVELSASGVSGGIYCPADSAKDGKLEVRNGAKVTAEGTGVDAHGAYAQVMIEVKNGGSLVGRAVGSGAGCGIKTEGELKVHNEAGNTERNTLAGTGANVGIAAGSAHITNADVSGYGQNAASENTGVGMSISDPESNPAQRGNLDVKDADVTAEGLIGIRVGYDGDGTPADPPIGASVSCENAKITIVGEAYAQGMRVRGDASFTDCTMNAKLINSTTVPVYGAALSVFGNTTMTKSSPIAESSFILSADAAPGLHVSGSLLATDTALDVDSDGATAGRAFGGATFENSDVSFASKGGYFTSGLSCAGTFLLAGGTFEATSASENGVGLRISQNQSLAPLFKMDAGDFRASGQQAGMLLNQDGDHSADPVPVSVADGILTVSGGTVATVVDEVLGDEGTNNLATMWGFSESGTITYEGGCITGAAPEVRLEPQKAFYLEVDGKVLVNADTWDEVPDTVSHGTKATFTKAGCVLTLPGATMEEIIAGNDENAMLGRIVAKGFDAAPHPGRLVIAAQQSVVIGVGGTSFGSDEPALEVTGNVAFVGSPESKLGIIGTLETTDGSIVNESGSVSVVGLSGTGYCVVAKAVNSKSYRSNVELKGGSFSVVANGQNLKAMSVAGDFIVSGSAEGATHSIMSIFNDGVTVGGVYTHTGGNVQLFGLGGNGLVALNMEGKKTAATLGGASSQIMGLKYLDTTSAGYGLAASGNVEVTGGGHMVLGIGLVDGSAGLIAQSNVNAGADGSVISTGGSLIGFGAGKATGVLAEGSLNVQGGLVDAAGAVGATAQNVLVESGGLNAMGFGELDSIPSFDATNLNALLSGLGGAATGEDAAKALLEGMAGGQLVQQSDNTLLSTAQGLSGANTSVPQNESAKLPGLSAAQGAVSGNLQAGAGTSKNRVGLKAANNITINGGTVNAFAFTLDALGIPSVAGDASFGMQAGGAVNMNGGVTVALADVQSSDSTSAVGISAGNIALTGGTTTAYTYQTAATRASFQGAVSVSGSLQVAVGDRAPGTQVNPSAVVGANPYTYVTDGALYLTNDHMKWDYLDTSAILLATAFDAPNGETKVSKEMMASIVGLNRMTMILSDNVDFSQGTFLASYMQAYLESWMLDPNNQNVTVYYGPMFSGTGAAFLFEHGFFLEKYTLHNVAGVEVFDFGSRYDTNPELAGLSALVPEGKSLVHSVHFNYEGELPADTTVFMAVGDTYKSTPVTWAYSDHAFTGLTTIVNQDTDPFGWLSVASQQVLNQETVIYADQQPVPASDTDTKTLVRTGDWLVMATWVLLAVLVASAVAVGMAVRHRGRR